MQQHTQETKSLVLTGKKSDTYANHFASLVPEGTKRSEISDFIKIKVEILWQGNPISTVKTFGRRCCKLCARERLEILKFEAKEPGLMINKRDEVHGACRHKPRFHRFEPATTIASTDESSKDERVNRPDSTKSASSTSSLSSNDETIFTYGELELTQPSEEMEDRPHGDPPYLTSDERRREGYLARLRLERELSLHHEEVSEGEGDPPAEELPITEDYAED